MCRGRVGPPDRRCWCSSNACPLGSIRAHPRRGVDKGGIVSDGRHKTSQVGGYKPLSPEQENTIDLLIMGKPDREVAECLRIARETVTRWRHEHPLFVAEMNAGRRA